METIGAVDFWLDTIADLGETILPMPMQWAALQTKNDMCTTRNWSLFLEQFEAKTFLTLIFPYFRRRVAYRGCEHRR